MASVKFRAHWVLLSALSVSVCGRSTYVPTRGDTYAVYAAALDSFPRVQAGKAEVDSLTWAYSPSRQLGDTSRFYVALTQDSGVGPSLLAGLDSANAAPVHLCDCFPPGRSVALTNRPMRQDVPGPIGISNVAFSQDGMRALVAVGYTCGALCGHWELYLVRRRGHDWTVERRLLSGSS